MKRKTRIFLNAAVATTVCTLLIAGNLTTALTTHEFKINKINKYKQVSQTKETIDTTTSDKINQFYDVLHVPKDPLSQTNDTRDSVYLPGEVIIKLKLDVNTEIITSENGIAKIGVSSVDQLNEKYQVVTIEKIDKNQIKNDGKPVGSLNTYRFRFLHEADILSVIQDYENNPHVVYAEPNYIYQLCTFPNDPAFDLQWALHNTGQTGGTPDADIDAPAAWDIETGDAEVVIAIVDSGVDCHHPDLAGNIWINENEIPYNDVDDDGNGVIDDYYGTCFIVMDPDPHGHPGSYSDYGLWKDETEMWHFRLSDKSRRYFGTITTDGSFHNVTPINLSPDEYTLTNISLSFDSTNPPPDAGFDFQLRGGILYFYMSIAFKTHNGAWLCRSGEVVIGENRSKRVCPFSYYIGNNAFDDFGHGTHCAGIISASGNNSVGVTGVCWNCTIMPVKAFNYQGLGYESDLANAIYYATDNGADVISMSWGIYFYSQLLNDALAYAHDNDVVLIAAAGNDNTDILSYPAGYDHVIAVAATDNNDTKTSFTNWGSWIDVAAPGVDIYSTMPTYKTIAPYNINYDRCSGTSMACPHVAGVTGLLLSKNHSLTTDMVRTLIVNTADEAESPVSIGRGRIDAYNALQRTPALALLDKLPEETTGTIEITGGAWGKQFQYYVVDLGRGKEPTIWNEAANSTIPIHEGVLASLDTIELDEGFYTVRLRVICSDGIYQATRWMIVNNEYNVIYVDDDNIDGPWDGTHEHPHRYIRKGIDDAGTGDTVSVSSGTYYENLVIGRAIEVIGENRNATVIDGRYIDPVYSDPGVVVVYGDGAYISGFTIQKSNTTSGIYITSSYNTIEGNIIKKNNYGIMLTYNPYGITPTSATHNTITDNTITHHNAQGIYLGASLYFPLLAPSYNIISGNNITATTYCGFYLIWSSNNTISDNMCMNTGWAGIYLMGSSDNIISGNTVIDDPPLPPNAISNGIDLVGDILFKYPSNNNIVTGNIVTTKLLGIGLLHGGPEAEVSNNLLYHNNFIQNNKHASHSGVNTWDNGYPSGGNYWDDYMGNDIYYGPNQNLSGSDGIGDIPYTIPGEAQDQYPLMTLFGPPFAAFHVAINNKTVSFNASISYDYDGEILCYEWDFGDNTTGIGKIINHTYAANGTYTVTLTVIDNDGNNDTISKNVYVGPDITLPEIRDHTSTIGFVGTAFTFTASITDNINVSTAWVEYWYGSDSHTTESMVPTGVDDYYEKTITLPFNSIKPLHYIIMANDTNNLWNTSLEQYVTIIDNIRPEWQNQGQTNSHINPDEQSILFAQGRDAVALDWAWLATDESGEWQSFVGPWWNYSCNYFKELLIGDPSAGYQMPLIIYKEDGYDDPGSGVIDCEGHCNDNFSDVRFVASDQTTLLPYWIEETGINNGHRYARIWVKTSGEDSVYMYYGTPVALPVSDGSDTFLFFEDFTSNTVNKWSHHENVPIPNPWLKIWRMRFDCATGSRRMRWKSEMTAYECATSGVDCLFGAANQDQYGPPDYIGFQLRTGDAVHPEINMKAARGGNLTDTGWELSSIIEDEEYTFELCLDPDDGLYGEIWDSHGNSIYSKTISNNFPTHLSYHALYQNKNHPVYGYAYWKYKSQSNRSVLHTYRWCEDGYSRIKSEFDWWFVAAFDSSEPSWASFGDEQDKAAQLGTVDKYGSPIYFDGVCEEWVWSNFTWQNASIPIGTTVSWRIYYMDSSGNIACTDIMSFAIRGNNPPEIPDMTGPSSGKANTVLNFTIVTTDPDGDQVYYFIDWGDGRNTSWLGPFDSGVEAKIYTEYTKRDTFTIKFKAKDTHDAESDWGTLEIEIPRNKQVINQLLLQFLERFLERFPRVAQIIAAHPFISKIVLNTHMLYDQSREVKL
jgi:parallel beta-helix repeat protein